MKKFKNSRLSTDFPKLQTLALNNPLQSPVRPSESAITKGYRLMHAATGEDSDDEDCDTAVKFGDLGVFDNRALDIV